MDRTREFIANEMRVPAFEVGAPYTGKLINKVVVLWNGKLEMTFNN